MPARRIRASIEAAFETLEGRVLLCATCPEHKAGAPIAPAVNPTANIVFTSSPTASRTAAPTTSAATITKGGAPIAPAALTVGSNVNITRSTNYESEGTIAVDPTNPLHLFAASNHQPGSGIMGAVSVDGGSTWTTRNLATGADLPVACCDAQATFDKFGNLYLVYLQTTGLSGNHAVRLAISTDGGATFTQLFSVTADGLDQPSVAAGGDSLNAANASVWISWHDGVGISAAGARVTAKGAANVGSFTQQAVGGSSGNFGSIAVGPNGQVVANWQDPEDNQGPSAVFCSADADGVGGGGFGSIVTVSATNVGGFDLIPAQNTRSIDSEANLAFDVSNGPRRGRLFLAYTDETAPENSDTDILLRYSDNNGATWSAPLRVNDDAAGRSQFFPAIATDPTTGAVAITFYDARNDNGVNGSGSRDAVVNNDVQFYGAVSTDGGISVTPNTRIGVGTSNAAATGNANQFGDYTGVTFYGGVFYPIWADNSTTLGNNLNLPQFDMATAKVIAPQPAGPRVQMTSPAGTVSASISSIDFTFDKAMDASSFSVAQDVASFTGPGGVDLKPQISGFSWLNGNTTLRVNFNAQATIGDYSMVIGPQILAGVGGAPMDQDADGTAGEATEDRFTAAFKIDGPRVISSSPTLQISSSLSAIDLNFNVPMDPASFSPAADIVTFSGPFASDVKPQVTGFTWLNGNTTLEVQFTPQTNDGIYKLTVGPQILSAGGLPMNQDADANVGEAIEDRYNAVVQLNPSIGPDGYGYVGRPVPFENINLSIGDPGVSVVVDGVDDGTAAIDLGTSTFKFYGVTYTGVNKLFVSSNGLISFATATDAYDNTDLTTSPTQAIIAPFWDDLLTNADADDAVLYRFDNLSGDSAPERLVIEWSDVPRYVTGEPEGSPPGTFAAILQLNSGTADGDITFNYLDSNFVDRDTGNANATIGIKAAGTQGTNRLLVTKDAESPYAGDEMALKLSVDRAAPSADVVDVAPDPRTTPVGSVVINFSEVVKNFNLADLSLTRSGNGSTNLLTGSAATITTDDNRTFVVSGLSSITTAVGTYTLSVATSDITDLANNPLGAGASDVWTVNPVPTASIAGSFIFYNNSVFDGFDAAAGASDDGAIATDKQLLHPGQGLATFANRSSYVNGINGVMIDVAGLTTNTPLSTSDFTFQTGNSTSPSSINAAGPAPTSITLRPGAGVSGSDRITLIWDDATAVKNGWLKITLKAVNTGLPSDQIFYFGNAIGETGDGSSAAGVVDSADYYGTRDHLRSYDNLAPVTWNWDFNRDSVTDLTDLLLVRQNAGFALAPLDTTSPVTAGGGTKGVTPTPTPTTTSTKRSTLFPVVTTVSQPVRSTPVRSLRPLTPTARAWTIR